MDIAVVTGPAGVVGGAAVRVLSTRFDLVVGLGGPPRRGTPNGVHHHPVDLRDPEAVSRALAEYGADVRLVVHTAAHPAHPTAGPPGAFDPAAHTTVALLEAVRAHCPDAVFALDSAIDVYGDLSRGLPLVEAPTRWELDPVHRWHDHGVDESVPLGRADRSLPALSLLAADLAAQDHGRRHGLAVGVFRSGPLTSAEHAPPGRHGFVSRLVRDAVRGTPFAIRGHGGKQVRDVLDAADLVEMIWHFYRAPRPGEVYHAGGGRDRGHSVLEVIGEYEHLTGREVRFEYDPEPGYADGRWWLTDTRRFRRHYPAWRPTRGLVDVLAAAHRYWSGFGADGGLDRAPTSEFAGSTLATVRLNRL
ncbi:NAD-dependent epimerase/dehydratase family protein [Saccharothrix obliqua]|uniref:NAD-dependent epimerase/dehydratase family protein n=1 Tax=Saccharothrix obliqua TaxID=2861747 RepID=UPI001C5F8D98|nr:NAD-dependent epimerase/dehydratase family protein [Saccharothrix obliqua]MBW4720278.1 NAD-dependent epimerase/dehydratase family protein [Saccharothrix obliqua]